MTKQLLGQVSKMTPPAPRIELAELVWPIAQDKWNAQADGHNQWDSLGRDEMSVLIVREAELQLSQLASHPESTLRSVGRPGLDRVTVVQDMTDTKGVKMKIGGKYNWVGQVDRLVYLGKAGNWHQFKKIGDPREVWCEVLTQDLPSIEETAQADQSGAAVTVRSTQAPTTAQTEQIYKVEQVLKNLESVLCGPDGRCCIRGSDTDRSIVDDALDGLRSIIPHPKQADGRDKTETLIERLRHTASKGVSVWGDLQMEAANEIVRLLAERYSRCSDKLRNLGKPYPRTCAECGLGPCKAKP